VSESSISRTVRVWDVPVRVFHGLLALSFAGAWLTAESERWLAVHVTLGYTVAGLVVFRLLWGMVGTRHARFSDFVRGPAAVARDLHSLLQGRPGHHAGHNPAGGWAILALLGLSMVTVLLGWATLQHLGGHAVEEAHEAVASLLLAVVGVHVAGVLLSSWLRRENLVRAMITGRKRARPSDAVRRPSRAIAAVLLAAVLGFWALQWQQAPDALQAQAAASHHAGDHDAGDEHDD
jgi:cytochrome b